MPHQKNMLHRLVHIAALLKENRYPNSAMLIRDFKEMELGSGLEVSCGKKTILRDMKVLQNEYGCPLAFDYARNGFYLTRRDWDFIAPAIRGDNELLAAVMGARMAEQIFPSPLRDKIRLAVDTLLQKNDSDFLHTADMKSLYMLSGLFADVNADIFAAVFKGWQQHIVVNIDYMDYHGNTTTRDFEPHTLVFYENSWYSKGFCRMRQEVRTMALNRITRAEFPKKEKRFKPKRKIISSVNRDDFLAFDKISGVELRINDHMREKLLACPLHSKQKFTRDGRVIIPAVSIPVLFPFLLTSEGEAELLKPEKLRDDFRTMLEDMLEKYR